MKKYNKYILLLVVIALAFSANLPAKDKQKPNPKNQQKIDLTGTWNKSDGGVVDITHDMKTQIVTATFKSGGECKTGDKRDKLFTATLSKTGMTMDGKMWVCTNVEKLVKDCSLDPIYTVTFNGSVHDKDRIDVPYFTDHVTFDVKKDGTWTNCSVKAGGGSLEGFSLTRQDPGKRR